MIVNCYSDTYQRIVIKLTGENDWENFVLQIFDRREAELTVIANDDSRTLRIKSSLRKTIKKITESAEDVEQSGGSNGNHPEIRSEGPEG